MRIQSIAPLFVLLAAATSSAYAQDPNILDDFSTGHYQSPGYFYGPAHESVQYGKMVGGSRDTNMNVCPTNAKCPTYNPYNQPSSYGFFPATATKPAAMVQSAGFYAGPRIDMAYGFHGTMHEDFGAYDKIRVNFKGLSQALNFNIQLFTGTSWAQGGCNIPTYPAEFAIELPLDKFVTTKGFTFSDVTGSKIIPQAGSATGSTLYPSILSFRIMVAVRRCWDCFETAGPRSSYGTQLCRIIQIK